MYGPTKQCNIKTYKVFQLSAYVSNLCLQPKSSLINRLTVCWMLDQPSFRRCLNSSISRIELCLMSKLQNLSSAIGAGLLNISHRILIDPLL